MTDRRRSPFEALGARDVSFLIAEKLPLRAGDRLVFLTDGMLERNAAEVDTLTILAETRHLHPREAVQALTRSVVEASDGTLTDDATVLCLDWHGGEPRLRNAREDGDC